MDPETSPEARPLVKVADLSPIHFGNKATDGSYGSNYWFPGFGFDSWPITRYDLRILED